MRKSLVTVTFSLLFITFFILIHASCTDDIVLYEVTFDSQSGNDIAAVAVAEGQKVNEPITPTKGGYTFVGWYQEIEGINEWNFEVDAINSNITLYAQWVGSAVIGALGPSGGYVFYDDLIGFDVNNNGTIEDSEKDLLDNMNDGMLTDPRYLEAAPAGWYETTIDPGLVFGYYRSSGINSLVGTGTALGTGKTNTAALVSAMGTTAYTQYSGDSPPSTQNYAAKICTDYSGGDSEDWFLPSKDELQVMYKILKEATLGNFASTYYWSSSEGSNYHAWNQSFGTGVQDETGRYLILKVRPVRAF